MKIKKVDNNELFSIKTIYEIKNDQKNIFRKTIEHFNIVDRNY